VKRVLLTHVSDELDELWVRNCAKRAFAGPIAVAREGAVYEA
jgi:ribonuclease BN (tRNA processing enzyme)